jgi:hypothetical protein
MILQIFLQYALDDVPRIKLYFAPVYKAAQCLGDANCQEP